MGLALGFASMNFHSILTDMFGASLMSTNPHQEVVDKNDVRRHGGGMGVWLGIWTWCFTGSLGVGFLMGAVIINFLNPSWGFYVSIIMIAVVLLLNVVCPEVRRSAYRRSVTEVRVKDRISRRVMRGEIMMHRVKDGPRWWWQEVGHGVLLELEMLRQPGFAVIAVYTGWIYAQVVLVIVLLGSLTSRHYRLVSPLVGLSVSFVAIGALIAVPFQKANIFSRGRYHEAMTSAETMMRKITWTSHLLRRAIFCIGLPLAGIAYTIASPGPTVPVEVPTFFAAVIGNLSGLAISECNGLMMETFDTSDLHTGMTGRPRGSGHRSAKRTNYSSFPRVTAAFAVCHTFGFLFAAGATGIGGMAQRNLGQRTATGVVAGILFFLTLMLLAVLVRFKDIQIIPSSKTIEMDRWTELRLQGLRRRSTIPADAVSARNTMTDEEIWRPIIIGNPSSKIRRVNVLELGAMTRWTEIRKKNRLIDESASHINCGALEAAAEAVEEATGIAAYTGDLVRRVSNRSSRRQKDGMDVESCGPERQNTSLPAHSQTKGAGEGFTERECVMGQTVTEEDENNSDDGDEMVDVDEEHGMGTESTTRTSDNWMERDHGAHMMDKVKKSRR
ncbi:hypothetical protein GQ53DRAFT_103825 [Thozetella sp. PMI_491]|nr:hypothetical protein GQ53DRAFT_103825 [Thozetella sp. PMI_491]